MQPIYLKFKQTINNNAGKIGGKIESDLAVKLNFLCFDVYVYPQ